MRLLTCCVSAFVLLAVPALVHAEAESDAAARAKAIAPFVGEETAIVAHIDLSRVELQPTFELLNRLLPNAPVDIRSSATMTVLDNVLRAGVTEFYLVAPAGNVGPQPQLFMVLPVLPGANERALRKALHISVDEGQMIEGALVLQGLVTGRRKMQPRRFQPVERPELKVAFEAAGDTAAQLILIPPAYTRRVIDELMPQLPKEVGGGPSTALTHGVSWAVAGIDFPPHESLRLVIKSDDAQAAEALRAKLADMLRLAGQQKQVREALPKFDEAIALLTPVAEGDQLVLNWNKENNGIEKFLAIVTPPIEHMQAKARRMQSMNNLKQIALAMHNYSQANKHFPLPAGLSPDGKPLLS